MLLVMVGLVVVGGVLVVVDGLEVVLVGWL